MSLLYGWRVPRAGAVIAVALAAIWLTVGVARAAQPLGTLTQLPGTAGCFSFNGASEDGAGTCSQAHGLARGESAAVSPDGANVYVGSYPNSGPPLGAGFAVFTRDRTTGALTQLTGTAGCLTSDGSSSAGPGTCTKVRGLRTNPGDGRDIAFTSDGRWAYIVAQNSPGPGAVMIFQRDPTTGALTQLAGISGCITPDGSDQDGAGQCQTDSTLEGPDGISISSDDRFVYVVDYDNSSVHVFARNTTTGTLSDVQCIAQAPAPTGCSTGRVLGDSEYLALSPDGLHAYGGQYNFGLSIFDRDPSTGLLTQKSGAAGCITDNGQDDTGASTCAVGRDVGGTYPAMVAPNGATLYDVAADNHGLSVFHINGDGTLTQLPGTEGCVSDNGKDNTGASTCATGREVGDVYGGVLSPDGASLYVSDNNTDSGGVAIFSLDQTTGVATQMPGLAGCISGDGSSDGTAGECTNGRALSEGYGMGISPDGHSVYQATEDSSNAGLAIYARETAPVCLATSAATAVNDAVSVTLRCADADGDAVTRAITSGPSHGRLSAINNATGTVTYTPAHGFKRIDSFTFNASDGVNTGTPATATITVSPASLSKLRISPSKASVAGRKVKSRCVKPTKQNNGNKHCRRAIKLHVSYTLSAAASVKFTVQRVTSGRKAGGKCVKQTKKNKHHAKCTRLVSVRGSFKRSSRARANKFAFTGKIGGKNLPAGTYKLTATPTSGTPKKATFTITG